MSSKALWKPKLHDVKSSFLNNFCNILEKKNILKMIKIFLNYGSGV